MLIDTGSAPPALGGIGPGGVEVNPDTGALEPVFYAAGEGAISILFDADQTYFGFKTIEGTSGTVYVAFFSRDRSLIDSLEVSNLTGGASFGFELVSGDLEIGGAAAPAGLQQRHHAQPADRERGLRRCRGLESRAGPWTGRPACG